MAMILNMGGLSIVPGVDKPADTVRVTLVTLAEMLYLISHSVHLLIM